MSLKLGIYEFFGRVIPGIFYLFALVQLGAILKMYPFDLQLLNQISLTAILGLGVIAYILQYLRQK